MHNNYGTASGKRPVGDFFTASKGALPRLLTSPLTLHPRLAIKRKKPSE